MIRRVGVVGAGLMGSGIAEVCARAGCDVEVHEMNDAAADAGRARITASLGRARDRGKLTGDEHDAALSRITVGSDLDRLSGADLVIEAASEDEAVKVRLFSQLDSIVTSPAAILATNTSSIPITRIAIATNRPQQVVGLHFFNPVPVLPLVELVPSLLTSEGVARQATEFAELTLGKTVVRARDRAGFIVNSLLVPYLLSAIRMHGSGLASAQDIDEAMRLGCAHPMGPLRLADLIGLDTIQAISEAMYAEFKEIHFSPPSELLRMVEAGLLGRKTGHGFYSYDTV